MSSERQRGPLLAMSRAYNIETQKNNIHLAEATLHNVSNVFVPNSGDFKRHDSMNEFHQDLVGVAATV